MSALGGIRVVELTDESAVYCGKLLADLGADVVKIEPPAGDRSRQIGPFYHNQRDSNRSLFFWHYNTNKRGIRLDPADDTGQREREALLGWADVLITSGRPSELREHGLDTAELAARHPHLIVVVLSGFGQSGPRCEWKSCDAVAQAMGGMAFINGHRDEPPLKGFGLQAYHSASSYAAIGVLLALLARERTGRGQVIDVSTQEAVAATVEHVSMFLLHRGLLEVRRGTLHWSRYFRVAKCRDGYALHCTLGDWTSLIEWVKLDGKAQDLDAPEWEDFNHRRRNCEHLFDVLDEWAAEYTVAELVEGAQLRRLPYAAVVPIEHVPENPQLRERGFFVPLSHPEMGERIEYPGSPYLFQKRHWELRHRAPLLGEHDEEVRAEVGSAERRAPSPSSAPPQRVLDGVRVLDFTWVVAGPVATRILADQGADVIKIERRDSLDFGSRRGGLTGNLNRGKRSVVLNMSDPRAVDLARRMVRECDIVIDNFSARVMRNWGLTYDALREIRPDIIAMSMSGFGHSGPHKDYVSYGPTLQALCGFTHAMRHPGGEPSGWGYSYSDMVGGYTAALAALVALWHRRRTGEGQFVDLSQFEAVTAVLGPSMLEALANGTPPAPVGNFSAERPAAPHAYYRCRDLPGEGQGRDRWCAICVFTEEEWKRFVDVLGRPGWAGDARFATLAERMHNRPELDRHVEAWTRERTAEEVMETLQAAGIASGIVANAEDYCLHDPHLEERGYWRRFRVGDEEVVLDGVPLQLSDTPGAVAAPGPLLGEHTDAVLEELLGLGAAEREELRSEGVIS